MSREAPSDSPGGFTQTNASTFAMPVEAVGSAPMPAPRGLHQRPRCARRSTLDALTQVLRSVLVEAAVGRCEPPQPLREVSISMPTPVQPADANRCCIAIAKVRSSTYGFQS